jgi:hypothetical protein
VDERPKRSGASAVQYVVMTTPHPVPVSGPYDPVQDAMDATVMAMQNLATLIQQPILLTILPRDDDPADGVFQPVTVSPWCTTCKRYHS